MQRLAGKTVIVTGAGGSIGRAISRRLAAEGGRIAVCDVDREAARRTADEIEAAGGVAADFGFDITDFDAVNRAVAAIEESLGSTDVLVNNAGWDKVGNFLETDKSLWEKVVAINLWGPLHMHHAVVRGMVERASGKVVNIASDAARVGSSGEAVYAGCKGAIVSFSKALAREVARQRICINVVCPGPTDTPLLHSFMGEGEEGRRIHEGLSRAIPFRRLGQPQDLVGAVAFLASDDASFITGQVLSVSGGLTMAG